MFVQQYFYLVFRLQINGTKVHLQLKGKTADAMNFVFVYLLIILL